MGRMFLTGCTFAREWRSPLTYSSLPSLPPCSEGDKLVPSVQKKMNELEVGLLHLQQNIDIPEIQLPIHATIQVCVRVCVCVCVRACVRACVF